MKKLQFISLFISLIILSTSCHRGNSITITNGDEDLRIHYSGDIQFNDDETAIQSMSPDGYLRYSKNDTKLIAEANYHGEIQYQLEDRGKKFNINDDEGKKLLSAIIKDMIAIGFDAKGRLQRLNRKGGYRAVLNEVDNLKSDFLKSMYLQFLLSADSVQPEDIRKIAQRIGHDLGSDFDKGNLLKQFPASYLKDSLISHAWFESVKTIESDFEKSNALKYISRQSISPSQFDEVVETARSMGSDFEKANVMKELMQNRKFADDNLSRMLEGINNINSDFEKSNLLKDILEKERPTGEDLNKFLDVVAHMDSEFDKGNLLKEMIDEEIPTDESFDKLLSVINHIESEFDRVNLLRKLASRNLHSDGQWINIISSTEQISSEFDKTNLLLEIASKMPRTDSVKTAFTKTAKTINSEIDYGRVMKAVQ